MLRKAVHALASKNIRLHKIVASRPEVLAAFDESEHTCSSVDFFTLTFLSQHTLGVKWDVPFDRFVVKPGVTDLPFTLRGVLAAVEASTTPSGSFLQCKRPSKPPEALPSGTSPWTTRWPRSTASGYTGWTPSPPCLGRVTSGWPQTPSEQCSMSSPTARWSPSPT